MTLQLPWLASDSSSYVGSDSSRLQLSPSSSIAAVVLHHLSRGSIASSMATADRRVQSLSGQCSCSVLMTASLAREEAVPSSLAEAAAAAVLAILAIIAFASASLAAARSMAASYTRFELVIASPAYLVAAKVASKYSTTAVGPPSG